MIGSDSNHILEHVPICSRPLERFNVCFAPRVPADDFCVSTLWDMSPRSHYSKSQLAHSDPGDDESEVYKGY